MTGYLVSQGLRQAISDLLGVSAPLTPDMVKELLCQLQQTSQLSMRHATGESVTRKSVRIMANTTVHNNTR